VKNAELKELYRLYSTDVFNYSKSLLKNKDDASDAVQDIFAKYFETRESFKGECSIKTWLLVLTRNYCYRKLNKKHTVESIEDNQHLSIEYDFYSQIEMEEALKCLNTDEYEIIYLREFGGYSYSEIGEILEIKVENVKIRLFRVRQKLKKFIK